MRAIISGNTIQIKDAFLFKDSIKAIEGRQYDAENKAWIIPLTDENVKLLKMFDAEFDESVEMPKDAGTVINDEPPIVDMPIKGMPYRHQIAAFNFALRVFGDAG